MERMTRQRDAIFEVLQQEGRPLNSTEILKAAQKIVPKLGIATVYRTINELTVSKKVIPVDLPGQTQRFEVAGKHHHHHFLCEKCDRLFEVEGCSGKIDIQPPKGFKVSFHEILLRGTCAHCK